MLDKLRFVLERAHRERLDRSAPKLNSSRQVSQTFVVAFSCEKALKGLMKLPLLQLPLFLLFLLLWFLKAMCSGRVKRSGLVGENSDRLKNTLKGFQDLRSLKGSFKGSIAVTELKQTCGVQDIFSGMCEVTSDMYLKTTNSKLRHGRFLLHCSQSSVLNG